MSVLFQRADLLSPRDRGMQHDAREEASKSGFRILMYCSAACAVHYGMVPCRSSRRERRRADLARLRGPLFGPPVLSYDQYFIHHIFQGTWQ